MRALQNCRIAELQKVKGGAARKGFQVTKVEGVEGFKVGRGMIRHQIDGSESSNDSKTFIALQTSEPSQRPWVLTIRVTQV
jgi:hypothetical protein